MSSLTQHSAIKHLIRRATLGVSHSELINLLNQTYEETVEQLLAPETQPDYDELTFYRYHPAADFMWQPSHVKLNWLYRMTHSQRYLEEKMALFWHHVFATGVEKVDNPYALHQQVELFRTHGMSNYKTLLIELAKNPAMLFWLDNQHNHKDAPNENWGRELLELFSLGIGHFTEKDVIECSRAFTGWTIDFTGWHVLTLGKIPWKFQYQPEDHDNEEKTFLGVTGNLNGTDIIDIILRQPACATFITRHLYNFFVEDELEVPKWTNEPPRNPEAIEFLSKVFVESGYEIKPVLRALFNSKFFRNIRYNKVKSPIEVVIGTLKLTGDLNGPDPRWGEIDRIPLSMGQDILDPPSVEGWHTGKEWITSGAFINRVNFVADRFRNLDLPGVKAIVENIKHNSDPDIPETIVDCCLEALGDFEVDQVTYKELVDGIRLDAFSDATDEQIVNTLSIIAGTTEYQFC